MPDHCAHMPLFKYTRRARIRLTPFQKNVREKMLQRFQNGKFKCESVACLCGSGDSECIAETERYGLPIRTVICTQCGLVRTNPRLTPESLQFFYSNFYRDLYMGPEYGTTETYFNGMIRRGEVILTTISNALPQISFLDKKVLEIGCSAGGILMPFLRKGAKVAGYDYDPRYINFGNNTEPNLNLKVGGLADLKNPSGKFNLIIVNHVLEHLYDPLEAVRQIRESLVDGGILYIGVPGLKNPDYYFSPTKSFIGSLHVGHVYHFTEQSLEHCMTGFKTLFIDNDIRAVFQRDESGAGRRRALEYETNLVYIKEYEYSVRWKLKRLGILARTFPSLMDLILPRFMCTFLRFLHKKVRSSSRC